MSRQAHRSAVVIGASGGIGQAVVTRLADKGLSVIRIDQRGAVDRRLDITDAAAVTAAAREIGPVDVLVNAAGSLGPKRPAFEITNDEWERCFSVNVTGVFNTCRAFAIDMVAAGWGRIVNIASAAGVEGVAGNSAYSAAKAAVIVFTKSLGRELAPSGVLVNAVAPGYVDTPMTAANSPDIRTAMLKNVPLARAARPEEVAELVAWLGSEKMSFSTGAVFDISGGRLR